MRYHDINRLATRETLFYFINKRTGDSFYSTLESMPAQYDYYKEFIARIKDFGEYFPTKKDLFQVLKMYRLESEDEVNKAKLLIKI